MRITVIFLFSLLLLFSTSAQLRDELKNKENDERYSHLSVNIETPVRGCNVAIQHCKQRVDAGQSLTGNATDEDLQLINTDNQQLMVEPPQQPKENNIVQQHSQENVCENKNECESEFSQWKNVSDLIGRYDWQIIVVLEDDPVVLQAASSLFERHASISTLLRIHKGQILLLRGSRSPLTSNSQVILVGHGGRDSDGVVRLGGYGAEELARIVSTMGTQLGMVSLVGCKMGKDLQFAERLLRELRSLGVESRLLLYSTLLSVSLSGEMLTRDEQGGVWRYGDDRTKVIAQLSQTGNLLTRVKEGGRGNVVFNYPGYALPKNKIIKNQKQKTAEKQEREWPEQPERFILPEYEEDPSLKLLEALAWAIFMGKHIGNVQRHVTTYEAGQVRWIQSTLIPDWEPPNNQKVNICIIKNIGHVASEILYHAKQYIDAPVYYQMNQYIYHVDKETLYVHVVGVQIKNQPTEEAEIKKFDNYKLEAYNDIRPTGHNFHLFYGNIEQEKSIDDCYKVGQYFLAAVFSESVRNFRQFVLFLLSSALCNQLYTDICNEFVSEKNPMTRGGTWPDQNKRGFYGWRDNNNRKIPDVLEREKILGAIFFGEILKNSNEEKVEPKNIQQQVYLGQFGLIDDDQLNKYCEKFGPCEFTSP